METNQWSMRNPNQVALMCYAQATAIAENPEATPHELGLAQAFVAMARRLGHSDEKVQEIEKKLARREAR